MSSLEKFNKIKKHLNLKQAMEAMINKDYDRAILLYSSAVKSDPQDWKIFIQRCNCYQKLNQLDDALKDAETAIGLNPTQLSGHYRKACVLMDKKQFRAAEKSFENALDCEPNDQDSWLKLKETHKLLLEEFGFKGKEADILVDKYNSCSEISDAIISGKLMASLQSATESVTSAESPRVMPEERAINGTIHDSYMTSTNGLLDLNGMDSSVDDMSLTDGDIRKPKTIPIFRRSLTPQTDTPLSTGELSRVENEVNSPTPPSNLKSKMVKTRPQIFRSIIT